MSKEMQTLTLALKRDILSELRYHLKIKESDLCIGYYDICFYGYCEQFKYNYKLSLETNYELLKQKIFKIIFSESEE